MITLGVPLLFSAYGRITSVSSGEELPEPTRYYHSGRRNAKGQTLQSDVEWRRRW